MKEKKREIAAGEQQAKSPVEAIQVELVSGAVDSDERIADRILALEGDDVAALVLRVSLSDKAAALGAIRKVAIDAGLVDIVEPGARVIPGTAESLAVPAVVDRQRNLEFDHAVDAVLAGEHDGHVELDIGRSGVALDGNLRKDES
jgi:hypothetical protein